MGWENAQKDLAWQFRILRAMHELPFLFTLGLG